MSNSVSSQLLLDALAQCVREHFSKDSLDYLCNALEKRLGSSDDPTIELSEALTNYVYQLRDGAIQATDDTTSLFYAARTLLEEDGSSRQGVSFDAQVANLLERIDLAASGGFDALEAGEVTEFDRLVDSTSESIRIQNTLHRIHASVSAIERRTQFSRSDSASFAKLMSRQRRLLDSLAPSELSNKAIPLTALEETLSVQLAEASGELHVDGGALAHPTFIPILSSLISQLVNTVGANELKNIQISRERDSIEIKLILRAGDSHASDLRTTAIERGFLSTDAPIQDGDELQYLLLHKTSRADEELIKSSALLDDLQAFCAHVIFESTKEATALTTTLPATSKLEDVTVFKQNDELYAILTESVSHVDYAARANNAETRSTYVNEQGSFRVISLSDRNESQEACLLINDGDDRIALFVDQMEPPGQLPVLDSPSAHTHVGGGVRLLDRRLVVLLSADELDEPLPLTLNPRSTDRARLLVLGHVPLVSQLNPFDYEASFAEGEQVATATFQEQRPEAFLVDERELAIYDRLLTTAKGLNVPVIIRGAAHQSLEFDSSNSEFKTIRTLTELEAQLQDLNVGKVDEEP